MRSKEPVPYIKLAGLIDDYNEKPGGGAKDPKNFHKVDVQRRALLRERITVIQKAFKKKFAIYPDVPCIARVKLHDDALAKSHRPVQVFKSNTCPVIGSGAFGEIFIQATEQGLINLSHLIKTNQAKKTVANISAIEDITPFTEKDALMEKEQVTRELASQQSIKVQLFKMSTNQINNQVKNIFCKHLQTCGAKVIKEIKYARDMLVYQIICNDLTQLDRIASFGAIRRIAVFPKYRMFPLSLNRLQGISSFPPPDPDENYPVVGLIDTGIPANHPQLAPWIFTQENYVPPAYLNQGHASFIGGIMAFGDNLSNHNQHSTGLNGVKILDIGVFPNNDPDHGQVDELKEDHLLNILQDVIPRYKNKVKIWNISLGSTECCNMLAFSDLAVALDSLQNENEVIFAIASGNYEETPQREWPPQQSIGDRDIICPPADSLRGMTVGAIAQTDNPKTVVKRNEPSSFSRRGFGPNFIVKPDLVHYGGNCDHSLNPAQAGLRSVDEQGYLVEGNGTSYSTPYLSALLASVYNAYEGRISLNLAKALVLHSCFHPISGKVPDRVNMKYYGYGLPRDLSSILMATRSTATLIYESQVSGSTLIKINDFPFPACMIRDGKCYGEIWMTLVYDPPLNNNYGLEYCRVNIDAALGRFHQKLDKKSGEIKESFESDVPYQPVRKKGDYEQLFERNLIEFGFKWSPVKRYYKHLQGMEYKPWGLRVTMNVRAEELTINPQAFALMISYHDPQGGDVHGDLLKIIERPRIEMEVEERVRTRLGI
ncbi:MAG: S8 family peptidase [Syntrophomonadaceae bacterium]|nr:S8 family peptidase [Syntrophomonadaceae bacterium]